MAKQPKTYPEEVQEVTLDEVVALNQEMDLYDDQVQQDELQIAKLLEGTAKYFDNIDANLVERLIRHGIAAKTDEGLMRGYKYHEFIL